MMFAHHCRTHSFAHRRYPALIVTFDVPVPAAEDDGATAAAASEVGACGDGGQPAAKRARVSSGAASSSAGGAASAAAPAVVPSPAAVLARRGVPLFGQTSSKAAPMVRQQIGPLVAQNHHNYHYPPIGKVI